MTHDSRAPLRNDDDAGNKNNSNCRNCKDHFTTITTTYWAAKVDASAEMCLRITPVLQLQ
ncbi:hypothetical protein N7449_007238 [Penicillium cf. viridicatum]|uniref:Uncharacterized protein n=1 Tax=Penicillium cf. viridicatum TaxID=2972119 RepID=A0A9W9JI49_9EURO|nr:hypothetical protein N7449_007238 [Penicillium cf. viridicatum]